MTRTERLLRMDAELDALKAADEDMAQALRRFQARRHQLWIKRRQLRALRLGEAKHLKYGQPVTLTQHPREIDWFMFSDYTFTWSGMVDATFGTAQYMLASVTATYKHRPEQKKLVDVPIHWIESPFVGK